MMFVRKICAALGATALVASGVALAAVAPAHADPANPAAIGANDIVGVGSDTTQLVVGDLANQYNATAAAGAPKLYSWDACTLPAGAYFPCSVDTNPDLKLRSTSTTNIVRPNGSGAGMALLEKNSDNPEVSFARSSSALDANGQASNLVAFPFAVDGLDMSVRTTTNAPSSLTAQQIAKIYAGTITNWNQVGGKSGAIHAYYPQAGSGTGKFFIAQLESISGNNDPNAVLAGAHNTAWNPAKSDYSGASIQEHDPTAIKDDPNAIAPFSIGRAKLINGTSPVIKAVNGWSAQRAVYNVLRQSDNSASGTADNPDWLSSSTLMKSIFGSTGFFCSSAAQATIGKNGFQQLKRPADGGACGVAITTAGGTPSNLSAYGANVGGLTARIAGTSTATAYGSAHRITVVARGANGVVPTGAVSTTIAGHTYSSRLNVTGSATVTLPSTLKAGTYRGTIRYAGDLNFKPATAAVSVTVSKLRATMATAFPKVVKTGRLVRGSATLRAAKGKPTGTVQVLRKGKRIATARVVNGVAHLSFLRTKLARGRNVLTVKYVATGNYSAPAPKRIAITRKR